MMLLAMRDHGTQELRQKLLDDHASLTVQIRDPFNQNGFAYTLDQPELFQELSRTWGGRQVGVTFSYAFGQQERRGDRDELHGDDRTGA